MAQQQAIEEHQKRLDAEAKLVEARKKRIAVEETQGDSLMNIRQAITKQRLVNRIRAAEDARIAEAALQAAELTRKEMEQRKLITEKVNEAVEAALASRKDATLLTGQVLVNATAGLTAKVSAANANTATMDASVVMAARELDELRAQAETSKSEALKAQQAAYEDRARADAAKLGSGILDKVKDCEDEKLANQTEALKTAQVQAATDAQSAASSVATMKAAEEAAFTSQGLAIRNLKTAAETVGNKTATQLYVGEVSQIAPEAFINGVASGIVGGKS